MYADSDNDEVTVKNKITGLVVMHLKAGDVSVYGNIVNGPALAAPITLNNLQCTNISSGATLYIYAL